MPENPAIGLSPPMPAVATTPPSSSTPTTTTNTVFANVFATSTISHLSQNPASSFTNQTCPLSSSSAGPTPPTTTEPTSLSLSPSFYISNNSSSTNSNYNNSITLFSKPDHHRDHSNVHYPPLSPQPAAMSATALLQKAAQMGAASSNSSLLRGFGLSSSSSSGHHQDVNVKQENSAAAELGLGLNNNSGLNDVMIDPSSLFGSKPTTLDLLGLGIGPGGAATSGLSALLTSFGGGFVGAPATASYGGRRGSSPVEPRDNARGKNSTGPALP